MRDRNTTAASDPDRASPESGSNYVYMTVACSFLAVMLAGGAFMVGRVADGRKHEPEPTTADRLSRVMITLPDGKCRHDLIDNESGMIRQSETVTCDATRRITGDDRKSRARAERTFSWGGANGMQK
jgi:hypothetical protein